MQIEFRSKDDVSKIRTKALIDTGAQVNTVGSETAKAKLIIKNKKKTIEVCSPLKGHCTKCAIGTFKFCLDCDNVNRIEAEKEFIILPKSREEPILGIKTIRDLDLVGKYPRLFRTEAAMARQSPPIVSAGDKVTTQKKPGEGKNKRKKNAHPESPWKNVKDSQGFHMGVPEAMKSRRILRVGGRRVDGKWHPADRAGLHGKKKLGVRKRKFRELGLRLATLIKNLPRDDGHGEAMPTSNEIDLEADAIEDGTIFHRDEIFDVGEEDVDAAEAEEAWMEKRELLFEEATTDPLAQIKIEGSPTLQRRVTQFCRGLRDVFRAQVLHTYSICIVYYVSSVISSSTGFILPFLDTYNIFDKIIKQPLVLC